MTRQQTVAPPIALAPTEVHAASDDTLVSALLVLTHQTHGHRDDSEHRVMRELVRAEVLRRMGGK